MMLSLPETADATPAEISEHDRAVFERYWDYDFKQDGFSHPSQDTVASDLHRSRYSVHRSVKRLVAAGYMRVHEKRWGRYRNGRRWLFNVYELLQPGNPRFDNAAQRIVERARARKFWTPIKRVQRAVHTNHEVVSEEMEFSGPRRRRMSDVVLR